MPLLSWVVNPDRRFAYGYLLPRPDVVSVAGFCPLLHGSQLGLLSELCVGPDGRRGPQMSDAPGPLCLLPPAEPQQLGAVPRGASLELDGGHRAPGPACGGTAGRAAPG